MSGGVTAAERCVTPSAALGASFAICEPRSFSLDAPTRAAATVSCGRGEIEDPNTATKMPAKIAAETMAASAVPKLSRSRDILSINLRPLRFA
jgi:hypothetical protein